MEIGMLNFLSLIIGHCTEENPSLYCFFIHMQSIVEFESVIVATAPYFEHTASLPYSLKAKAKVKAISFYFTVNN